mgnify:CR=1 FL=1
MSKDFNDKDLVSVIATLKSKLYQESIKSKHFNELIKGAIMSMSDGEVIDLLYDKLNKTNDKLKQQLEEIYEALVGDNGMERFTHAEIIDWAHQLVDKEEEI